VAQALAVALHELTTNAAKYGALSEPRGHIDVAWRQEKEGRLILRWTETGGPAVTKPERRGFGSLVTERMISQLNGNAHFDWRPEGLVCEIAFRA
jgi:two-component sensor histidine kinase